MLRPALPFLCLALLAGPAGCGSGEPPAPAAQPATLRFGVEGMHCDGCANAIAGKVKAIDGVESCEVSLEDRSAEIAVRDANLAPQVRAAIEGLGYRISE